MLNFNGWMKISNINKILQLYLEWSYIVVENELFQLSCNELHYIYDELKFLQLVQ